MPVRSAQDAINQVKYQWQKETTDTNKTSTVTKGGALRIGMVQMMHCVADTTVA